MLLCCFHGLQELAALLGQHVLGNAAEVVQIGDVAPTENLFARLRNFVEIAGRASFDIAIFLRPVPADEIDQLVTFLVIFPVVVPWLAPVAMPLGSNRVVALRDDVVDIGDQLMALVNHHAARFIVHLLGGLLNVRRRLPHRSLNAGQRNAVC